MTEPASSVPAVEGWFTMPPDGTDPVLIGCRCETCGTYVFPPRDSGCPNPACIGESLVPAELSNTGAIWSYTVNHYAPPPPYVAADPFEPYALAAVELDREGLIVLGQVAAGVDPSTLRVGMRVKLDLGVLFRDDDGEHIIYTWAPA